MGAIVIAHRGASGYAPEHTFAAYDLALEQGADYIEQDLQLTADGVLVVLHDATLDRTARGPAESCTGPVADQDARPDPGVRRRVVVQRGQPRPRRSRLRRPARSRRWSEVFERYGTDVHYYIEIKAPGAAAGHGGAAARPARRGRAHRSDRRRRARCSSSRSAPTSLQTVHELRPELPLVQLLVASDRPDRRRDPRRRSPSTPSAIGPSSGNVDAALVDAAHARCLDVHPYTVNEPAEMAALPRRRRRRHVHQRARRAPRTRAKAEGRRPVTPRRGRLREPGGRGRRGRSSSSRYG